MLKNNKHWLRTLLVFFVVGMLLMPHLTLAKSSNDSKLPPELQNLPRIMELTPDPDSEVELDEVVVINDPKGKGQIVRFKVTLPQNVEPGGVGLDIDFVRGTYKATKELPTEEIKHQLDQNVVEAPSMTSEMSGDTQAAAVSGWTIAAALLTEDAINIDLCQTTQRLYWYTNQTGAAYMWVWAANPSLAFTHWYVGGYYNYPVYASSSYVRGRSWAWYYNWDWLYSSQSTTVTHDLYIYGYYNGTAQLTGYVYRNGETWWLLHSHLYWWQ